MLKQKHTQRPNTQAKKHSVVKRQKVVAFSPSKSKTSSLRPPPAIPIRLSLMPGSSSSPSLLSLTPPTPILEEEDEYDPTTQLSMRALQDLLESPSNLMLDVEEEEEDTLYEDRRSYAEKMDFFENFKEIPDIEDISPDISVAADVVQDAEVEQLPKDEREDEGKFVDPLLGLQLSAISILTERSSSVKTRKSQPKSKRKSKPKPKTETKPKPQTETKTETKTDQEPQLSDLMITESQTLGSQASALSLILPADTAFSEVSSDMISHATKEMREAPGVMLESFFELVDEKDEVKDEDIGRDIYRLTMTAAHEARTIQQVTQEFLTALISKVVECSEFRSEEELLAENLDKRKLLVELAEKSLQYEAEVGYNRLLESKVIDILIRRKLINQIRPSKFDSVSKPKYHAALWDIEQQLTRESATKRKYENTKNALQEEIRKFEKKSKKEIQAFETLVKLKLNCNDLQNLNQRILPYFAEMTEVRKNISATRYKLILLEDTQADLNKKLAEIKDLGHGLTVENFHSLLNNNQELQKKIEERDGNLYRLHSHLQRNINILAHYAETKDRLHQFVQRQRLEFKELRFERERRRRHLQNLNIKRIRTRQEIKEMSYKAGLLDKPLLMHDYDKTVEQIEEDKERIGHLRATLATIEHKIKVLEESLSNSTVISYAIR